MSEHLRAQDVAGLVMLAPSDPERERAEAHARACAECASELMAARRALEPLATLETGLEASQERLRAVRRAIAREVGGAVSADDGRHRRIAWASAFSAVACAVLAAAIFRGISESALSWLIAGAALLLGMGAILTVRDETSGRTSAVVASVGALGLAMLSIEPSGGVEWEHAAYCGGTQLIGALAPALVALLYPGAEAPGGWTLAGRGAGGALVTLSALSLVCPAHSAVHVLVFHVLSIAIAAAGATAFGGATLARQGRR